MKRLFMLMALLLAVSPVQATSVQDKERTTINGTLEEGALVCRSKRSLLYLLQSEKNYQKVVNGLESKTIYKNCFYSIAKAGVNVVGHYKSSNLIKSYYVLNHLSEKRYVPIEFVEPINGKKKKKVRHHKKRTKKYAKKKKQFKAKSKKVYRAKKHTKPKKHKVAHVSKKVPTKIKQITKVTRPVVIAQEVVQTVSPVVTTHPIVTTSSVEHHTKLKEVVSDYMENKKTIVHNKPVVITDTATHTKLKDIVSDYVVKKKTIAHTKPVVKTYTTNHTKVYRCSAVSFEESFTGEHIDRETSKKMALDNCKKYQKNQAICVFENCFILRISSN